MNELMNLKTVMIVIKKIVPFVLFVMLIGQGCSTITDNTAEKVNPEVAATDTVTQTTGKKVILFFGNSITAAYGLESADAFTTLIQARLDSLNGNYEVINAGVSGETTASGKSRVKWIIEKQPVDIFVLELGANDGLRGLPVKETKANLESIIDQVRKKYPDVLIILAGMMIPPSMGPEYSKAFQQVFPDVAKNKDAILIPFVLENVAGIDSLNLPDGIHPNAAGEKIVFENIWAILKDHVAK